jgi:hypothetical protein
LWGGEVNGMGSTSESVREDLEAVGLLGEDPSLKTRQRAYNVAKDLKSNKDWDKRTQKIAADYFALVHKHGSERQREKAAKALYDQLEAERDSAQALAAVAGKHMLTFRAVGVQHAGQARAQGEAVEPDEQQEAEKMSPEEILAKIKEAGLYVPKKYEVDHIGRVKFKLGGVEYGYKWAPLVKKLDIGVRVGGGGGTSYHFHVLDKWEALAAALKKIGVKT